MDKELYQKYIYSFTNLVGLYLNQKSNKDIALDKDTISFFIKFSKKHSLTAFLYKVIKDTGVDVSSEVLLQLNQAYLINLRKVVAFNEERKDLYKYLNDNQIDYLPLKGIVIKDYYLDQYSREFADNDILYDKAHMKTVKQFFVDRDYKVESIKKGAHDTYLKSPFYNFEMHRILFVVDEDYLSFVDYFNNYLSRAKHKEGHEYEMSKEDFYIYFTAHAFKHYVHSGCGLRTLVDYYFYLKKNKDLDFDYINKELDKLDLREFSNNISSLAIKVFDNQNLNDEEKEMLLYIASSGTYGTLNHSVIKGVNKKGKFGYFMSRIFPPMSFYRNAYPFMYKTKVLIPFAWIHRCFRVIFTNPKKAVNEFKMISKTKKKNK